MLDYGWRSFPPRVSARRQLRPHHHRLRRPMADGRHDRERRRREPLPSPRPAAGPAGRAMSATREAPHDKRKDWEKPGDAANLMGWIMGSGQRAGGATRSPASAVVVGRTIPSRRAGPGGGGQCHWTPERRGRGGQRRWAGRSIRPSSPDVRAARPARSARRLSPEPGPGHALGPGGGLGVSYLTRGQIWPPIAFTLIVLYPGFRGAIAPGPEPAAHAVHPGLGLGPAVARPATSRAGWSGGCSPTSRSGPWPSSWCRW